VTKEQGSQGKLNIVSPMNLKKLLFAVVAAFAVIFVLEFVLHAVLLKSAYMALPKAMMRPEADFQSHFPLLVLGQLLIAFALTLIFATGFAGGGVAAGMRLGLMFGLIYFGTNLITFAVQPFTGALVTAWTIGGFVEMAIAGAVVGAIYKPATPRVT
jgi:hypothetical protein